MPIIGQETHRKWSWADEQGWLRYIRIPYGAPVKEATNPVLSPDGVAWDSLGVSTPFIYYDVTEPVNKFKLYYMGQAAAVPRRIGLAQSTDGVNFTKYPGNPVVDIGLPGSFDDNLVQNPSIVCYSPTLWYMWYLGHDGVNYTCGRVQSIDRGYTWTNKTQCVMPANFYAGLTVNRIGNLLHMPYATTAVPVNINVATSPASDGLNWTDRGNILTVGAGGAWDDAGVMYQSLFWNLGVWYLLYSGVSGGVWQIGVAASPVSTTTFPGFGVFGKYPLNPVLSGTALQWDSVGVLAPNMIMIDDTFWMYYVGCDTNFNEAEIGLATIP